MQNMQYLLMLLPALVFSYDLKDDMDWSAFVSMDAEVTLNCNNSASMIQQGEIGRWTVPSEEILTDNHNDSNFKVQAMYGIEGYVLIVKKVTAETQGVYVCIIYNGGEPRDQVVRLINFNGPKYENMNERYETHIIIAVIATATFIGLLLIVCLTYRFRYRSTEEKMFAHNFREVSNGGRSRTIADTVSAPDSKSAYDNPGSTKL
ncbi:uncharacterized protein LOC110455974 [Mizuhopecten yessoensis]|uniref:Ig-like domain-containing protein n=1 Tax=Mizuhopecten yessoensis TaxID=6573 RepID=A0A210QC22_MIZYE|nr:uncharacterized protein LOC110455974 [Mizuhopecten yessoensis]XP_021362136.1 uncharacterized protein LOC110455974 [Mizuhopecten yessoensis]OWF46270.1 hypothetical protein KP79_PYT13000 [Mizuhopecten yessoensis]